jgi:hypothetical protein
MSYLVTTAMLISGYPTLLRLNRYAGLDTDLEQVCYRAVRVEIEHHAQRVTRALVRAGSFHGPSRSSDTPAHAIRLGELKMAGRCWGNRFRPASTPEAGGGFGGASVISRVA